MHRKTISARSAQLALARRKMAQESQSPKKVIVDSANEPANVGPYAGHKAGKRKRGVSVLKRKPRAVAVATKYIARDSYGNVVARFDTLTYKRPE